MIFSSALLESTPEQKVAYIRYFTNPTDRGGDIPISSGFILQNYWKLLEAEFKPKGNKLLSVIELWTRSRQGSKTLNE